MTPNITTTILTGVGVVFGILFVMRRLLGGFERDLSNQIEGFRRDISGQLSAINTKIDNVLAERALPPRNHL